MKYCDHCSKTSNDYSDIQGFRRHMKSHEGELSCDHCEKVLKNKRVLMKHIKTVHDNKTFTCGTCQKVFKEKANFKKHLGIHEPRNSEQTNHKHPLKTCDRCYKTSKDFSDSQGFNRHIKSHEEDVNCENKRGQYQL